MLFEAGTTSASGSQMILYLVCSVYHFRQIYIVSREVSSAKFLNDMMVIVSGAVNNLRYLYVILMPSTVRMGF